MEIKNLQRSQQAFFLVDFVLVGIPSVLVLQCEPDCVSLVLHYSSQLIQILGPLSKTPGCFLARVESLWQITLLRSSVNKHLHENSSQASSGPLAG